MSVSRSGAQIQPSSAQLANHWRTQSGAARRRNARADEPGLERIGQRQALANGGESEKLFALEPQVKDRKIHAMRGEPSGAAAQSGQLCGCFVRFVMLHAGFAGLALVAIVQAEHKVVGGIAERDELQVRLQCEARTGVKRGDLIEGERGALGAVEGFNKRPLDAGDVESQSMAASRELADWRPASRRVSSQDCAARRSGWDAR